MHLFICSLVAYFVCKTAQEKKMYQPGQPAQSAEAGLFDTFFIRPSKTGRIMGSPVAGGRRPHSLSGAYLQDYANYVHEILWVDRSHQKGVQCI